MLALIAFLVFLVAYILVGVAAPVAVAWFSPMALLLLGLALLALHLSGRFRR